jgi:hypothetical protein
MFVQQGGAQEAVGVGIFVREEEENVVVAVGRGRGHSGCGTRQLYPLPFSDRWNAPHSRGWR